MTTKHRHPRHVPQLNGDDLTVFRMNGRICIAIGRQDPQETVQMDQESAYDLAGKLFDAADDQADIEERQA